MREPFQEPRDGATAVARPHDAGPELKPRFYGCSGQLPSPLRPALSEAKRDRSGPDKTERAEIDPRRRRVERETREEIQNHVEQRGRERERVATHTSGYAYTMGPRGRRERGAEGKSGELIVARAADEAATICGPDLWTARIYHRGHTRAYACAALSLFLARSLYTFLSSSLFSSRKVTTM